MAAPSKFNEETRHLILSAIRSGAFDYLAAEAAGIGRDTFRAWVQRGHRSDADLEFLETLAYRDVQHEARSRGVISSGTREEILQRLVDKELEYQEFSAEVRRARALARVEAERNVFKGMPFNWLRYGPGRERPGEPGWTEGIDPATLARVSEAQAQLLSQVVMDAIEKADLSPEQARTLRMAIADGLRVAVPD